MTKRHAALMDVFLGYASAYRYWRSFAAVSPLPRARMPFRDCVNSLSRARKILETTPFDELSLELMVSTRGASNSGSDRVHYLENAPGKPFMRVAPEVCVACPELCFLQMATVLPFIELVRFGCELCATYAVDPYSSTGLSSRDALTTKTRLARFLSSWKGAHGVKAARSAVPFICENAASPREIALSLLVSLPYRHGGFGLSCPLLNYRIDVRAYDKTLGSKSFYRADLCWPEKRVIIEYESDQWHTGAAAIAEDARRRNALIARGFTVISVTNEQIKSASEMRKLARILARLLSKRISAYRVADFDWRVDRLRSVLLGPRS